MCMCGNILALDAAELLLLFVVAVVAVSVVACISCDIYLFIYLFIYCFYNHRDKLLWCVVFLLWNM